LNSRFSGKARCNRPIYKLTINLSKGFFVALVVFKRGRFDTILVEPFARH